MRSRTTLSPECRFFQLTSSHIHLIMSSLSKRNKKDSRVHGLQHAFTNMRQSELFLSPSLWSNLWSGVPWTRKIETILHTKNILERNSVHTTSGTFSLKCSSPCYSLRKEIYIFSPTNALAKAVQFRVSGGAHCISPLELHLKKHRTICEKAKNSMDGSALNVDSDGYSCDWHCQRQYIFSEFIFSTYTTLIRGS